jgi:hypothetical protein
MYLQPTITIQQTIDLIKEKIKSNEPFALSRYGDGEIHFLNRTSPPEHQKRQNNGRQATVSRCLLPSVPEICLA